MTNQQKDKTNRESKKCHPSYGPSAYNSQHITPQDRPVPQGLLQSLRTKGQMFHFRRSTPIISTAAVSHNTPSQWVQIDDYITNQHGESGWDEQRLEQDSFSNWTQIYMILSAIGKVCCQFILPLVIVVFLTMPLYDDRTNLIQAMEALSTVLLYVFLPLALLWGQAELVERGYFTPWFLKAKKQFSLSRQTGMVTLYKGSGKPRFSHPFIEFDCILVSAPSPQGLMNYALYLVHRYNGYAQGIPLHSFMPSNQSVSEYQALWNMIQRYMDTSQPMPDILILEAARERDPITAQYDAEGKRNHPNNYWRSMTDETFTDIIQTIRQKQQQTPAMNTPIDIFK